MGIKKENEQLHQEKKYQFMKEQLRPDRKKQAAETCRRLGILAVTAILFGGIAGAAFLAVKFQFDKPAAESEYTDAATAKPTQRPVQTPTPLPGSTSGRKKVNLSDYNRLSEELAAVGETLDDSMVGVQGQGDFSSLWQGYAEKNRLLAGLIFQESGQNYYILTVCDTIKEQTAVKVRMMDETVVKGRVVGSDASLNLAVISIKKAELTDSLREQVRVCRLDEEAQVVNGSKVVAVGCPSGVLGSVMTGSVVHDEITVPVLDNEMRLFSTDMQYCEQSNGVVLNQSGRIIGMITRQYPEYVGKSGLAFVDMASIKDTVEMLRKGKKAPYFGIVAMTLEEAVAQAHNLTQGVYVTDVYAKSPAYNAGMRVADVIIQVNGEKIQSMDEVYRKLTGYKKKEKIVCTVIRGSGKKQTEKKFKITLG